MWDSKENITSIHEVAHRVFDNLLFVTACKEPKVQSVLCVGRPVLSCKKDLIFAASCQASCVSQSSNCIVCGAPMQPEDDFPHDFNIFVSQTANNFALNASAFLLGDQFNHRLPKLYQNTHKRKTQGELKVGELYFQFFC